MHYQVPVQNLQVPFSYSKSKIIAAISLESKENWFQVPEPPNQNNKIRSKLPKKKQILHRKSTTYPAGSETLLLISKEKKIPLLRAHQKQ